MRQRKKQMLTQLNPPKPDNKDEADGNAKMLLKGQRVASILAAASGVAKREIERVKVNLFLSSSFFHWMKRP